MADLPNPQDIEPHPVVANIVFPEGPGFDDRGNLYFVNYLVDGSIGRLTPDGTVSLWVHTGGSAGGIKYDGRGHIVVTDNGGRRIVRFDTKTRAREVLADNYLGRPFKGPNDLCLDTDGNVYFTDPGPMVMGIRGEVYRVEIGSNGVPGPVTLLDEGLDFPNGIALHPEGDRLYVAVSRDDAILGYDLQDGCVSNRRVAYQFDSPTVDGIAFDEDARLWVARFSNGTVDALDVDGSELLASYAMGGTDVTNLCFWNTSLYVTVRGRHSIERLDLGIRGARTIPIKTAPDPVPSSSVNPS